MASLSSTNSSKEMKLPSASASMDDTEFDLHQNYHNAIECIVHCESIIATLQDQLASKDERIGTLEEKIVQMSLELASSKALEDEHRLLTRRMTSFSSSSEHSHPQAQSVKTEPGPPSLVEDFAPTRMNNRRHRSELSRSWSASKSNSEVVVTPTRRAIPQHAPIAIHAMNQMNHALTTDPAAYVGSHVPEEEPKRPRGFGLSRQISRLRMNMLVCDDPQPLDSSLEDSSKENMAIRRSHRCESSPVVTNMMGMRQQQYPFQEPSSSTRRNSSLANNRRSTVDEPCTTRRLTNFGQFLRGMNKNDDAENTRVRQPSKRYTSDVTYYANLSEPRSERRDSISGLSGVVFPVSSSDCLAGLDENHKSPSRSSYSNDRRANFNDEWPSW